MSNQHRKPNPIGVAIASTIGGLFLIIFLSFSFFSEHAQSLAIEMGLGAVWGVGGYQARRLWQRWKGRKSMQDGKEGLQSEKDRSLPKGEQ